MAAQAVKFLDQAGIVTALGETLWDTSEWLPQNSISGNILHALIGYNEQPTAMQLIVYCAVIVAMWLLMKALAPQRTLQPRAAA
jgi:high-affinity iron transporter